MPPAERAAKAESAIELIGLAGFEAAPTMEQAVPSFFGNGVPE